MLNAQRPREGPRSVRGPDTSHPTRHVTPSPEGPRATTSNTPPGDKLGGSGTALPLDATREKDYALSLSLSDSFWRPHPPNTQAIGSRDWEIIWEARHEPPTGVAADHSPPSVKAPKPPLASLQLAP